MEKSNGHGRNASGDERPEPVNPNTVNIPTIIFTDYDADIAAELKKREIGQSTEGSHSNQSPKSSPNPSIVNESEEEDREIIESLTKAHSSNMDRHVDVDETTATTIVKTECTDGIFTSETLAELKSENTEMLVQEEKELTDDDKADLEVSELTSLLESKDKFVPLPSSILKLCRPTAKLVSVPPPPGVLPDISDVKPPRYNPFNNGSTSMGACGIEGHFEPLGAMSFSVGSRYDEIQGLPTNGNRRSARLFGESDCDSHCSSSTSSDEQPPMYWKLYDNDLSQRSDGAGSSRDDINRILNTFQVVDDGTVDDNISSASNNLQSANFLSKQSEDESKK